MEEAASVCNWYSLGATKAIVYLTDFTLHPPEDVAAELLSARQQCSNGLPRDSFKSAGGNGMPDGAGTYRGRYYN